MRFSSFAWRVGPWGSAFEWDKEAPTFFFLDRSPYSPTAGAHWRVESRRKLPYEDEDFLRKNFYLFIFY